MLRRYNFISFKYKVAKGKLVFQGLIFDTEKKSLKRIKLIED